MQMAIVADDLTSATDGSVALAQVGWSVKVARGVTPIGSEVLSVDLASRTCTREEAVRRVQVAGAALSRASVLVKQFDSTLRGHVAAETLALLRASGRTRVVVAAAFPSAGRTTVDGCQLVDGIPVAASVYAQDPLNPVRCSDILALFEAEGAPASLSESARTVVLVRDARTERDLDAIVEDYGSRSDVLLAGSTGLLRALARCGPQPREASKFPTMQTGRRALVVVGSLNPRSRAQLYRLSVGRSLSIITVSVSESPIAIANRLGARFETERVVAITTPSAHGDPHHIAEHLGQVAGQLMRRATVDILIVSGGDIFGAILDSLGANSLDVLREIEPGIPICKLDCPMPITVISKAGGFGSADFFSNALSTLLGCWEPGK
jgi:D-threonate/D-erythronate kinase